MTSTAEILKAARKLIEKPENWTQGAYARDRDGNEGANPLSEEAICFCSFGAVVRASGEFGWEARRSALRVLINSSPDKELIDFNDKATHSEVLDLFSKAIAAAEASS